MDNQKNMNKKTIGAVLVLVVLAGIVALVVSINKNQQASSIVSQVASKSRSLSGVKGAQVKSAVVTMKSLKHQSKAELAEAGPGVESEEAEQKDEIRMEKIHETEQSLHRGGGSKELDMNSKDLNLSINSFSPMVALAQSAPLPPTSISGFAGINTGVNIPDSNGAVGPNHVVTVVNSSIFVQNKSTGAMISGVSQQTFWSSISSTYHCDSRIIFYDGRFIMTTLGNCSASSTAPHMLLLAVSATNDPTGNWYLYSLDGVPPSSIGTQDYMDLPQVGANQSWITISADYSLVDQEKISKIMTVKKSDAFAGLPLTPNSFDIDYHQYDANNNELCDTVGICGQYHMFPAYSTSLDSNLYFVSLELWGYGCGGNQLFSSSSVCINVSKISGSVDTPIWSLLGRVPPPNANSYFPGGTAAPQLGGIPVDPNDGWAQAVFKNGSIFATFSVGSNATPSHTSVYWVQLGNLTTVPSVVQNGTVEDHSSTNPTFYIDPSIAINSLGDMLLGFSCSSATTYLSTCYVGRKTTDPVNMISPVTIGHIGEATYTHGNRWGDYSGTALDPSDGSLWTIQEYAKSDSNSGTWWNHVNYPAVNPNAPSISITSPVGPDGMNVSGSTKFTATATTSLSNIKLYIDNVLVKTCNNKATCSYTWNVNSNSVAVGNHILKAVGTNSQNLSTTVTKAVVKGVVAPSDITPPSAPTNLTASNITSSGATLSWTASTDNVGVVGYDIYKNSVLQTSTTNTTIGVGLSPSTTYTFFVKARDAANNSSASSNTISVTTLPVNTNDISPPIVSILLPTNNSTVSGTSVLIHVYASDNFGVVGVQVKLDGNDLGPEITVPTSGYYDMNWNTTTTTNGAHIITALARDAAGLTSNLSPKNVTVSN